MKIFLSHSSIDKPLLREIRRNLAPGLNAWLDERELDWGSDLAPSLEDAIEDSDLFIIFLSNEALESQWVMKELKWATRRERGLDSKFVLPILMPNVNSHNIPEGIDGRLFIRLQDRDESSVKSLAEKINGKILQILINREDRLASIIPDFNSVSTDNQRVISKHINRYMFAENEKNIEIGLQLKKTLDTASKLIYFVVEPPKIYQHDRKIIEGMKAGSTYRATHPFSSNKKAHYMQSPQFQTYIKAQIDAADRNIRIKRLYILPGESIEDLSNFERSHLSEICRIQAIESKITFMQNIPANEYGHDFVIFDNKLLGIAVPRSGEMLGSEYRYSVDENLEVIEEYKSYFDMLFDSAISFDGSRSISRSNNSSYSSNGDIVSEPAFVLQTPASINGEETQRLMIVLRTAGCAYDQNNFGCSMCDFKRHALDQHQINKDVLMQQLEYSLSQAIFGLTDVSQIDLLTLGSFLHDNEVSEEFRFLAFQKLSEISGIKKIVIESRSPYITAGRISPLKDLLRDDQLLEIGLGIESSNESIRNNVLRKNLSETEIRRVISVCANTDVEFLAYLLIGSMTLTEEEAVEDAINSANYVANLCQSKNVKFRIAFEPVFITHNTQLEEMYNQGKYTLINLWRVVDIIKETCHLGTIFVGLSDEGLSSNRIPQGCKLCTHDLREAIEKFNGTQLVSEFDSLNCACRSV